MKKTVVIPTVLLATMGSTVASPLELQFGEVPGLTRMMAIW
jgi:hypothetical protein